MKKRIRLSCLVLALLCMLVACISPDTEPLPPNTNVATDTQTEKTENTTDASSDPLDPPSWESAVAEAQRFFEKQNGERIVDHSKREYSYAEMQGDLEELAALYGEHFSYRSFGRSVAGRELYVAVLGDPQAKQQILVSAGIHGREYLTPLLAMMQIEFTLYYYNVGAEDGISYRDLLDNCCFYIVPMTNPDGIMLSQAGLNSLSDPALRESVREVYNADFAKGYTSQTDIDEYLKYWKANARGVDLNRNFDALWEDYRSGERVPCHKNHKGSAPASEPETQAMVALTESIPNLQAVLCLHSQGEVLYWDCGQPEPLHGRTYDFTASIAAATRYEIVQERNNDASYSDWCALKKGLIAITVETGVGICPLDLDKLDAIWYDCFALLAQSAAYFYQASRL